MTQEGGDTYAVNPHELQNLRLYIGTTARNLIDVSLRENLHEIRDIDVRIRQPNNPQRQAAAAPAPPNNNNAAPADGGGLLKITVATEYLNDNKEYLDRVRGWLMTVATLFVGIAFQAGLNPPEWLSEEPWYKAPTDPGHNTAAAPSPDQATIVSSGSSLRGTIYLISNAGMFGTSVCLVLALLHGSTTKYKIYGVKCLIWLLALTAGCSFVAGASNRLPETVLVLHGILLFVYITIIILSALFVRGIIDRVSDRARKLRRR